MKRFNWLSLLLVVVSLLLVACGDSTTTPTTSPATTVSNTTVAAPTQAATTTPVITTQAAVTTLTTSTSPAATSASSTSQFPVSVTDGSGTAITVSKKVERIVCLTWECLDNMIALGIDTFGTAEAYLSPAGQYSTKPELLANKLNGITKIGNGNATTPDLEGITKYKPDLVITSIGDYREALKNVTPIYVQKQGNGYQSGIEVLRDLGKLTGREAQAETAIKNLQNKLNLYKAKSPNNKSIMLMRFYYFPPPIYSSRSVQGSLLGQLTKFPWDSSSSTNVSFVDASFEKILDVDPDVIFFGQIGQDATYSDTFKKNQEQYEANPFWQQLKAVKTKQLYPVEVWQLAGGILAYQGAARYYYDQALPRRIPKSVTLNRK